MSSRRQRGRARYRLTVKLDYEWAADLIGWLQGQAPGGCEPVSSSRFLAGELERVLSGSRLPAVPTEASLPGNQAAARYGDKLNRTLGGFAKTRGSPGYDYGHWTYSQAFTALSTYSNQTDEYFRPTQLILRGLPPDGS
jgi:hypothetical protein